VNLGVLVIWLNVKEVRLETEKKVASR